jgi:hypothetical protein
MKFLIGIPYVTGPEFTEKALASLQGYHTNVVICDCSEAPAPSAPRPRLISDAWEVDRPIVPYNFTQTMNYFQQLAIRREADFLLYMHNDAEAGRGTVEKLLFQAEERLSKGQKWGVLFTNYDALAAFNVKMFAEVGPWDARIFPFPYYADNDYYRRVNLAGYELVDTNLPCLHHGSHSLKISPRYRFLNDATFRVQRDLFVRKWGADPNEPEKLWNVPFNGELPEA